MLEICMSGSEGGGDELNRLSLPLSDFFGEFFPPNWRASESALRFVMVARIFHS